MNTTDLIGCRFGRLTVIKFDRKETKISKRGIKQYYSYWLCKCDCGKEISVRRANLTSDSTKSCGCLFKEISKERGQNNFIDLAGKRFSKLLVLGLERKEEKINSEGIKHSTFYWKCKCDCGNLVIREGDSLRRGNTKSCGCLNNYKEFLQQGIKYRENKILKEGTRLDHLNNRTSKANTTGVRGVTFDKATNKYRATIEFQGKRYHLGRFKTLEEAKQKREEAEEKYYKPILEKYNYKESNEKEEEFE